MGDEVFINKLSAIHKGSPGKSMAFPDVNLCPPSPPSGPIPTPLPNVAQAADLAGGAATVKINGNPVAKKSSYFAKSKGNAMARSTGGGVMTHVVEGKAYFTSFSMNVKIEGESAVRHLDMMTHNHAAPTPGEAVGTYIGSMQTAMPKGPLTPEPGEREQDGRPFTYEMYLDLGDKPSAPRYSLKSSDGAYEQDGVIKGREGNLTIIAFSAVLPGKLYTLLAIRNDVERIVFLDVPSSRLYEHRPVEAKASTPKSIEIAPDPMPVDWEDSA